MSPDDYKQAEALSLRCSALSAEARAFTDGLLMALPWDKPAYHKASIGKRRKALQALVADLMRLEARGLAGYHGMSPKDFPSAILGFGYDVFTALKDAMVSAGLLVFEPGRPHWISFRSLETGGAGDVAQSSGWAGRFRLTAKAVEEAEAAGVVLNGWADHWSPPAPLQLAAATLVPSAQLVELRAAKERRGASKPKGLNLTFDMDAAVLQPIVADLKEHNALMQSLGVAGVDFVGLRRILNDGDRPGFAWNRGGRFYSLRTPGMAETYETLAGEERRRRIRIAGESVAEADMTASQLRLLYALLSQELPDGLEQDLYDLPGVHRTAVKLIVTQAIGKESVCSKRWGSEATRDYHKDTGGASLEADHPFKASLRSALAAHPILERLGQPGTPTALGLQYVESEVVRAAMAELRAKGIGSLPVHDSLVVPERHLGDAEVALQAAFRTQV
jgi:hypothetical protein